MKERDDAVSPVIGVMLMLVVTIIIAAVISGFAGGLVTSQEPAPSASFDVSLTDKSIDLTVRSISEPIRSKDISIVLSKPGQTRKLVPGPNSTVPFGFNIVEPPVKDEDGKPINGTGFHDNENVTTAAELGKSANYAANWTNAMQWFGNYTLKTGSRMSASGDAFVDICSGTGIPDGFSKGTFTKNEIGGWTEGQWTSVFGDTVTTTDQGSDDNVLKLKKDFEITDSTLAAYLYGKGLTDTDSSGAKLNAAIWATASDTNWKFGQTAVYGDGRGSIAISPGDRVTVTIVHTPSGQTMFMKTVTAQEG